MKAYVVDIVAAIFLLAIVLLLVRPSSLAPSFIKTFGDALSSLINYTVNG